MPSDIARIQIAAGISVLTQQVTSLGCYAEINCGLISTANIHLTTRLPIQYHQSALSTTAKSAITLLIMVPSSKKTTKPPIFAPSPPLSASDPEHDAPVARHPRQRRRKAKRNSSSSVTSSLGRAAAVTANTSFASDLKQEEVDIHTGWRSDATQGEGSLLLTPERRPDGDELEAARAFALIQTSWQGTLPDDLPCPEWHVLTLSPCAYTNLCRRLAQHDLLDYFRHQLRSDYDEYRGLLTLRLMATRLHETLQDQLLYRICHWLESLAKQARTPVLRHLASDIISAGHSKVRLTSAEGEAWKSPDCQFHFQATPPDEPRPYQFAGSPTPPCVIEIGYSQKATNLEDLAVQYYEESDIKTVLTIDVGYAPAKTRQDVQTNRTAVLCLYRGPECIYNNVAFRDARGQPVPGIEIELVLADFVPDAVLAQLDPREQQQAASGEAVIVLTSNLVCKLLGHAERLQQMYDAQSALEPAPKKKRKIHWEKEHVEQDATSEGSLSCENEGPDGARSKRRRVDASNESDDQAYSGRRRHGSDGRGAGLPRTVRTRSMSRSEGHSDEQGCLPERRRTRSMSRSEGQGPGDSPPERRRRSISRAGT